MTETITIKPGTYSTGNLADLLDISQRAVLYKMELGKIPFENFGHVKMCVLTEPLQVRVQRQSK